MGSALSVDPPDVACLRITARKALCPSKSFMTVLQFHSNETHDQKELGRKGFILLIYSAQVLNPEVARVGSNLGSLTLNSLF